MSFILRVCAALALTILLLTPVMTQAADPPIGQVTLSPQNQTHMVGETAQFTATVRTEHGFPVPNATVKLVVSGVNSSATDVETTGSRGQATLTYVGTLSGNDTVYATATFMSYSRDSNSVAVHWNAVVIPATVTLSPASVTLDVGGTQTITAALKNSSGTPLPGETIRFSVTGANPVGATAKTTDGNGQATFSYTGTVAGRDYVNAFWDEDNDGVQEGSEPGNSATVTWINYSLMLSTTGTTAAVKSTQPVTATLTDSLGNATSNVVVHFTVTGANPITGTATTDANGKTTFSYTGTKAGIDTIGAWADVNKDGKNNGIDPSTSTTITWSTSYLSLSPLGTAAPLGSSQTITATVKGASNNALANVSVVFKVTGVNPTSGTQTTNSSGQASFAYVGTKTGVDTVTVYADIDGDNSQDNGEPGATTTVTWLSAAITLSPLNPTAAVTTSQSFTATVKNTAGTPLANVTVRFVVTGANPSTASGTTDANGHASYAYTGTHPGTDTLSAYADIDRDDVRDAGEPQATTSITWTTASLTLSLSNASAQIGTTQSVTATLKNANDSPIPNVTIRFKVTGANPTTVNVLTNANGRAGFSYKGVNAGTDTIHAYGDLDKDGTQDSGDPVSNVTLTWTTVPVSPVNDALAPASPKAGCTYFAQTQHNLCAGFAAYWNHFGGLDIYGYPLTEEFQQNGLTVQYFERARFEWHPGAWPERYDVLLGLLGDELTVGRTGPAFQRTPATGSAGCTYFVATAHNLCGAFQNYWNQFGGLAVFGMPISEPFVENGMTVQYFERARFELHPGAWPERYNVLLGRVGAEVLNMP